MKFNILESEIESKNFFYPFLAKFLDSIALQRHKAKKAYKTCI
jgi:hypothetical protein